MFQYVRTAEIQNSMTWDFNNFQNFEKYNSFVKILKWRIQISQSSMSSSDKYFNIQGLQDFKISELNNSKFLKV